MTGKDIIKQFEGLRLVAYQCSRGRWTIGWGHTRDVKPWHVITEEEAEAFLEQDYKVAAAALTRYVNKQLNTNQKDALVSLIFNIGEGNFAGSTIRRKVNQDPNDATIRDEFPKWRKVSGEVNAGLVRRRAMEAELYFSVDNLT